MHRRIFAAGLLIVVTVGAGCTAGSNQNGNTGHATAAHVAGASTTAGPKRGGTLVYAADQEPPGFNVNTKAAHTAAARTVMDRVWPSVYHVAPDFSLALDKNFMASASLTNQDPQTLVLKINPSASWSDGVPITADDFIYFWQRQRDPLHTIDSCNDPKCTTNGKPIDDYTDGAGYRDIKSVIGSDGGNTVTVVFSQPYGDWKSLWSYIVPAHLAQKVGWNHGFDIGDPNVVVSGGPFTIHSYNKGVDVTLVPNDKYWATRPSLDAIVVRVTTDPVQQVAALQNREADMIYPAPALDLVTAVKGIPDINSEISLGTQLEQLDFNVTTPGLDDVVVRKAIATAIDRPSLARATVGKFTSKASLENNRIFLSNQSQYRDSSGGVYDHGDVVKAKKMLEVDGYQLAADGVYAKNRLKLSFRIATTVESALGKQTEALLQAQLIQAGIDLKLDNGSAPVSLRALSGQAFDLALVGAAISPFASDNSPLYARIGSKPGEPGNAVLDQYLAFGYSELDVGRQALFFNGADAIMWQNMWTLPLHRDPTLLAVRQTFVNVHDNVTPEGPFWNAETWGLRPLPSSG